MACPCGLSLSPGAPLLGGAGLGLLGQQVGQNLRAQGVVCQKSGEIFFDFQGKLCYQVVIWGIGSPQGVFPEFCLGKATPKNLFGRGGQAC
jgi:hypothetical protein